MALTQAQIRSIEEILKGSIRHKLKNYKPETKYMPFHIHLLGKDRMALFSFIQSLNTTFGMTIFEPVAVELAKPYFPIVQKQFPAGTRISSEAHREIQRIIDGLTTTDIPNKFDETERIRAVCQSGEMATVSLTLVDLMLQTQSGEKYYFDLKTAKPNIGDFKGFKRTLLEWVAATLAEDPNAVIHTAIAIPYNPYEPKPYERWTIQGRLDADAELFVGKEFWDMVGGEGAYEELLNIFETVGIELRPEIDARFSQFR